MERGLATATLITPPPHVLAWLAQESRKHQPARASSRGCTMASLEWTRERQPLPVQTEEIPQGRRGVEGRARPVPDGCGCWRRAPTVETHFHFPT